jgi:hypothetical protein
MTISGTAFSTNSAFSGGGGIDAGGGALSLVNCTFLGNNGYDGGAISADGGSLTISGCTLTGNTATYGGGIFDTWFAFTLSASTLSGNIAGKQGGGVWLGNSTAQATIENGSSVTGNTAPTGYGPDVYNLGVVYIDATSTIGILNGNPPITI